jgi:hypothetical protein
MSDGKPSLKGSKLIQARTRSDTLAALVAHPDGQRLLHVLVTSDRKYELRPVGEFVLPRDARDFALSADGRRLAWAVGERRLEVHDVGRFGPPLLSVVRGRVHADLEVHLGSGSLAVQAGRHAHLITWQSGRLEHRREVKRVRELGRRATAGVALWGPTVGLEDASLRFKSLAVNGSLMARVSTMGEVALFQEARGLVAMFFFFRDQFAAYGADGTRLGPPSLTGGPPTPGAHDRLGAALRKASDGGGSEP